MNICPSSINLLLTKTIDTNPTDKDNFSCDKFILIDDEKTAHLKYICINTANPFLIIMLGCHKFKDQTQNYCNDLSNAQATKKACESNITDYIFFHIKRWIEDKSENKTNDAPMYILAFVRYSNKEEIYKQITAEIKKTAEWLSISGNIIQCYIFYYTGNYLCNASDRGTFKKKFNEQCIDPKYIFQFVYVPPNKKPQYLNIKGGSPQFTIEVQKI